MLELFCEKTRFGNDFASICKFAAQNVNFFANNTLFQALHATHRFYGKKAVLTRVSAILLFEQAQIGENLCAKLQ